MGEEEINTNDGSNLTRIYGIFDDVEQKMVFVSLSYTDIQIEMTSLDERRFIPCEFDIKF